VLLVENSAVRESARSSRTPAHPDTTKPPQTGAAFFVGGTVAGQPGRHSWVYIWSASPPPAN